MIDVKNNDKSLRLKDIFPEGIPKAKELNELRQAFSKGFNRTKPWYPQSENSLGTNVTKTSDVLSDAAFVDTDLINGATKYINAAGDALANALVGIEFSDVSHKSKGFTITTSGSLAE